MLSPSRVRVATQLVSAHFAYIGEGAAPGRLSGEIFAESHGERGTGFFLRGFTLISEKAVTRRGLEPVTRWACTAEPMATNELTGVVDVCVPRGGHGAC